MPVLDDIVLSVFLDSEYGKGGSEWRLGKVTAVKGSQISIVTVLLSFIFCNACLKVHIHRLSGFRIYKRSLRYSNIYSLHKTSKKDIQYLRSKSTYLKTLCIQDHSYCLMYVLTPVIML